MADHREVMHERLYLKEPGTERLRKGASGRLRYLLATGWRETDRWQSADYILIRVERTGVVPRMIKLPKPPPPQPRAPRRNFGPGQPGGPRRP